MERLGFVSSRATDAVGVTDESDGRRNGARVGRWVARRPGGTRRWRVGSQQAPPLDALFKDGFVDRRRSRLALDDEASRSGRHSRRAERAASRERR